MKHYSGLHVLLGTLLLFFGLACEQQTTTRTVQPQSKAQTGSDAEEEDQDAKAEKERDSADAEKEDDEDDEEQASGDADAADVEETPGICFYEEVDYEGEEACWAKEKSLDTLAFSPQSIKVTGKWSTTLWDEEDGEGEALLVEKSVADLDDEDFSGLAKSAKITKE